jgi:hypothetical protein
MLVVVTLNGETPDQTSEVPFVGSGGGEYSLPHEVAEQMQATQSLGGAIQASIRDIHATATPNV